jgi:hypothetical protein
VFGSGMLPVYSVCAVTCHLPAGSIIASSNTGARNSPAQERHSTFRDGMTWLAKSDRMLLRVRHSSGRTQPETTPVISILTQSEGV